ncbi:MAG: hypothetical protein HXX81_07865 [Campylobacterales bacterium]|nr:hypothetical protein [Campylobacterales bacterium]
MLSKDIQNFQEQRVQIRAYMCYLFSRNVPNKLPSFEIDSIEKSLHKIKREISDVGLIYILDSKGNQVNDFICDDSELKVGKGENKSNRAYFYRTVNEKRCILTDPYPCSLLGGLVVTAAYPLYNEKGELTYILCMDIKFTDAIKLVQTTSIGGFFNTFSKTIYFMFSLSLFIVAMLLFYRGVLSITGHNFDFVSIDIKEMFESTILLTLSLAIFDLVKAIFEEEVIENKHKEKGSIAVHQTMTRFLGSIIIALAIEALMLVFKFALIDPKSIIYAVYLIGGVTMLLFGLSLYIRFVSKTQKRNF